jgi:hypothetical protein
VSEHTGISNRQPPEVEEEQRHEFPPVDRESPPPQDAAGRVGEEPMTETPDRQTSHKRGMQSIAQKEEGSKYSDRPMPQTRKVAGAFGKEPGEPEQNS